MMNIEEVDERVTVHHVAKTALLNFLGCCGLMSFLGAPFMLWSLRTATGPAIVDGFCGGITGLLFGTFALMAARAPRTVDLVFDKRTGELDARIQRLIGTLQRKIALGEIRAVRTYTLWGPGRCGVQLRLASDELFTIVEGASFPGVKRDATQLADRLATFLGAPREDN